MEKKSGSSKMIWLLIGLPIVVLAVMYLLLYQNVTRKATEPNRVATVEYVSDQILVVPMRDFTGQCYSIFFVLGNHYVFQAVPVACRDGVNYGELRDLRAEKQKINQ